MGDTRRIDSRPDLYRSGLTGTRFGKPRGPVGMLLLLLLLGLLFVIAMILAPTEHSEGDAERLVARQVAAGCLGGVVLVGLKILVIVFMTGLCLAVVERFLGPH